MNENRGLVNRIYHVVPRFAGELFRATRAPSLIILFYFSGLPILMKIATYITYYWLPGHTDLRALLLIGMALIMGGRSRLETHRYSSIEKAIASMSANQILSAKILAGLMFGFGLFTLFAFGWWLVRF